MKFNMNKKQTLSIAGVLATGVVLTGLILGTNKPQPEGEGDGHGSHVETSGHGNAEAAPQKARTAESCSRRMATG